VAGDYRGDVFSKDVSGSLDRNGIFSSNGIMKHYYGNKFIYFEQVN
jgi:hypothetical protein